MPDPTDFDLPDPPPDDTPPPEPPAPPPDDTAALRARQAELEAALRQQRETNERLLGEILASRRTPPPPSAPEPPPPDRDTDPDAYIAWAVDRRVKQAIESTVAPLVTTYQNDRTQLFESTTRTSLDRIARDYPDLWASHAAEVEQYLNLFPAQERARPGAVEEAFARVVGRHTLLKAQESRARGDGALPSGRPSAPPVAPPPARPQLSPEQLRHLSRTGMSPEEFVALRDSGGRMDVDEYTAFRAATKKKGAA